MLCFSKKAIRADEDPHEGPKRNPSRGRRSIIKKVSDKIKKWVRKPKQAPPNPSPEPHLGRRNEMVLDLNDPLPFYKAMHCMDPDSPSKKPPSDPKKKIIFTTSSSQFMRIQEVVPQHQGIRIGSQGHRRPVGMNIVRQGHGLAWRPNLIEYKKVEESRGDETDLSLYLEKGKGMVQYPEESDSDSDSDADTSTKYPEESDLRFASPNNRTGPSCSIRPIQDIPLLQDGKLLWDKGKGIVLCESDSDTETDERDYALPSSTRAMNEEIPIQEFAREVEEAVQEGGQIEEEIPVQEISREAIITNIPMVLSRHAAHLVQPIPFSNTYDFVLSQLLPGRSVPPSVFIALRPNMNMTEYKKTEEISDLSRHLEKGKWVVQFSHGSDSDAATFAGPSRVSQVPLLQLIRDSDKERWGLALSSEIKTEESRSGAIQVEEIPVEEVSLEPNEIVELPPKQNLSRGRSVLSLASPPLFGALSFCNVSNTRGRTQRRKPKQMRTLLHFPSSASCGLRPF